MGTHDLLSLRIVPVNQLFVGLNNGRMETRFVKSRPIGLLWLPVAYVLFSTGPDIWYTCATAYVLSCRVPLRIVAQVTK